jgi:hypothetical protein
MLNTGSPSCENCKELFRRRWEGKITIKRNRMRRYILDLSGSREVPVVNAVITFGFHEMLEISRVIEQV